MSELTEEQKAEFERMTGKFKQIAASFVSSWGEHALPVIHELCETYCVKNGDSHV